MDHRPEAILIVTQWERAKGELRAAVRALGALPPVYPEDFDYRGPSKYEQAKDEVEAFIAAMDDEERFDV